MPEHYEVIVIGTGAGGGTLAHSLPALGKKILLLASWNEGKAKEDILGFMKRATTKGPDLIPPVLPKGQHRRGVGAGILPTQVLTRVHQIQGRAEGGRSRSCPSWFVRLLKPGKAGLLADGGQLSQCSRAVVELPVEKVKHGVHVDVLPFRGFLTR